MNRHKASYFQKLEDNKVKCTLCPHYCNISEGKSGICGVRVNNQGILYSNNYAQISSIGLDPIEKKPLYHFYPGTDILSIGTTGCNLSCSFCQNWRISQEKPQMRELAPAEITELALNKDVSGIAYTYSEPSVWFEFIRDTASLAQDKDLKNVLVTNGFINKKPLEELLPFIDGVNIDLKSIRDDFYHKYCHGQKEPVIDNIKLMNEKKIHLEITTLLITGLNESSDEMEGLFDLIEDINPDIPLHLSRYFPAYQMDRPATPIKKMKEAYNLAKEYLNNVYLGNVRVRGASNTYCSNCNEKIIIRDGYLSKNITVEGKCPHCGSEIYGEY